MKKKICKNCRRFVEGEACEACGGTQFTTSFQGRMTVLDVQKSKIAKKAGVEKEGEYAIKIR
ncbi:MAG TPA: transcription elongation factor subunit Spt4 [Candidatus Nanoarchaeia archaeon]|nr:transcription elongation factor subunit Spt4 [Candidatus Nanoarchaeia archaeon]